MIGAARRVWESFRGVGEAAVTVPPMDGALRANRALEEADLVLDVPAPDGLALRSREIVFSAGPHVYRLDRAAGSSSVVAGFDAPVTALAASADGALAVGLEDGRVIVSGGAHDGRLFDRFGGRASVCPTALLFDGENQLIVAQGSATRPPSQWKPDLMERCATGSVWRVSLADGEAKLVAGGLGWPYGLAHAGGGGLAISESWRHRVVLVDRGGSPKPALADLPGYPSRLSPASEGGGYWLSVFAPRNQLIEFVQREPEFLARMMQEIAPEHWAAPSLTPASTFLTPLQGGAQKQLGILKPWAPSYSYGLVVRLDRQFRPLSSLHSRADGRRHGVTDAIEVDGELLVASKGGDAIAAVDLGTVVSRVRAVEVG